MVTHMKTTMDLPDELVRRLREAARSDGVPMRELMVEGLRREIDRRSGERGRVDFCFHSVDGEGLARGMSMASALEASYGMPPT